jgi:hypothetical protein
MVSKVEPGRAAFERMGIYRSLTRLGPVSGTYAGKFALAAFIGGMIPLAIFIVYLLFARSDWQTMYPVIAALILASFAGFLGTLWLLRELLVPIDLTAETLRAYIDNRKVPDLPIHFPDRAGRLMEGTQYTPARSACPRKSRARSATCRPSRSLSSTSTSSRRSTTSTATAPATRASPTSRRCSS